MASNTATTDPAGLLEYLGQWTTRINEKREELEAEIERWKGFRTDYDALAKQLETLPDETTRQAMIPVGKLAFMPGKLVHTNEILVLLGDQYFAERSVKQALGILDRRKQVVEENLRLVEAQLNALNAKSDASASAFPTSDLGVDEEGRPIVEIREELPPSADVKGKRKAHAPVRDTVMERPPVAVETGSSSDNDKTAISTSTDASVDKERSEEYKKLMDYLQKMEEEEEELGAQEMKQRIPVWKQADREHKDQDDETEAMLDEGYDMEVSESIFDHFDDDEQYATEGIVEQEDSTSHDLGPEEEEEESIHGNAKDNRKPENVPVKETVSEVMSTPTIETSDKKPDKGRKRISRFKASRQKEREEAAAAVKSSVKEAAANQDEVQDKSATTTKSAGTPKKVSWGDVATVKEHNSADAPSSLSDAFYTAPIKPEHKPTDTAQRTIKSPADIFSIVREQQQYPAFDDYPSLDDIDEQDGSRACEPVDLNELAKSARKIPQTIWRQTNESIRPIIEQVGKPSAEAASADQKSSPTGKKSKLDTNIMKGAVMERETEPVDIEKVEEDMDLREVAARYHRKRHDMVAAMGGLTFEGKPTYEVVDEELPLPTRKPQEPEIEKPKKISRFKAARLGIDLHDVRHS